jgi:hypothetical protein
VSYFDAAEFMKFEAHLTGQSRKWLHETQEEFEKRRQNEMAENTYENVQVEGQGQAVAVSPSPVSEAQRIKADLARIEAERQSAISFYKGRIAADSAELKALGFKRTRGPNKPKPQVEATQVTQATGTSSASGTSNGKKGKK